MRDFLLLLVVLAAAALILGATTDLMPKPVTTLGRQVANEVGRGVQEIGQLLGMHNEYFLLMPRK